jgi:preprotein translocase subunit SecA
VHHVNQGLRAHKLFQKDKDYIVRDGEVVLIDEFTGRMMAGRRLSDGLHQAIEAKEGCQDPARERHARQRDLPELLPPLRQAGRHDRHRRDRGRGIHGDLRPGVVEVPTNLPIARVDEDDRSTAPAKEKYDAIVDEIARPTKRASRFWSAPRRSRNPNAQPDAESGHAAQRAERAPARAGGADRRRCGQARRGDHRHEHGRARHRHQAGRQCRVQGHGGLAADPEADPDEIRAEIEAATPPTKQKVKDRAGGLFVLATERHESRRIDNQLRGRSGRQGDPGRSSFFLSRSKTT